MNTHLISVSGLDILRSIVCGGAIACIFLFLLWKTTLLYTKYKKGLILVISFFVRIGLVLFLSLLCSFGQVSNLLWLVCSFVLTRFLLLKLIQRERSHG